MIQQIYESNEETPETSGAWHREPRFHGTAGDSVPVSQPSIFRHVILSYSLRHICHAGHVDREHPTSRIALSVSLLVQFFTPSI